MENKAGVYKIIIGDDFYIGSSVNVRDRAYQHTSMAKAGREPRKIQKAYNLCGEMHVDILEIVPDNMTLWELRQRERHWIEKLKPTMNDQMPARDNGGPEKEVEHAIGYLLERYKFITSGEYKIDYKIKFLKNTAKMILYCTDKAEMYLKTIKETRNHERGKNGKNKPQKT